MTGLINISSIELAEFDHVFQIFDANGDGSLTRTEIIEALEVMGRGISARDRRNLLERVDDNGVVTRDRFIEWMSEREDLDIIADLREIFNLIDVDRSGHLSRIYSSDSLFESQQ